MDAPTPAKRPTPAPAPPPVPPVPPPVPAAQRRPPPPTIPEEVNNDNEEPLVHSFSRVKDAVYAPPTTNNVGVKPKPRLAAVRFPNLPNPVQTRFGTGVQGSGSAEYLNPNLLAGSGSSKGRTQT